MFIHIENGDDIEALLKEGYSAAELSLKHWRENKTAIMDLWRTVNESQEKEEFIIKEIHVFLYNFELASDTCALCYVSDNDDDECKFCPLTYVSGSCNSEDSSWSKVNYSISTLITSTERAKRDFWNNRFNIKGYYNIKDGLKILIEHINVLVGNLVAVVKKQNGRLNILEEEVK